MWPRGAAAPTASPISTAAVRTCSVAASFSRRDWRRDLRLRIPRFFFGGPWIWIWGRSISSIVGGSAEQCGWEVFRASMAARDPPVVAWWGSISPSDSSPERSDSEDHRIAFERPGMEGG